jgi:hypothetical protein
MEDKSNEASKALFQCSYDALKAAAKLGSAGAADVTQFVDSVVAIKESRESGRSVVESLKDYVDYANKPRINSEEESGQLATGVPTERVTIFRCYDKHKSAILDFYEVYRTMPAAGNGKSIDPEKIRKIIQHSAKFDSVAKKMVDVSKECGSLLDGRIASFFDNIQMNWENISSAFATVRVLADCGVSIGNGGYLLVKNTACLIDDVEAYYEGVARTERMEQRYVESEVNTDGDSDPIRESFHCMAKYGIHLQTLHSLFDFTSRAYTCAEYCGNRGKGMAYMSARMSTIYPASQDRKTCQKVAVKAQSDDAIRVCLATCCESSASCKESAWQKLRYYNL